MKRLLIIAYYFPPDGGPGTQRPAAFCRHLPSLGWQPVVISRDTNQRGRWDPEDPSLVAWMNSGADVHRVKESADSDRWSGKLPVIDRMQSWVEPIYARAAQLLRETPIDAVLVTMSPFSMSHVAHRLRSVTSAPVIVDLRDPWALDGWQQHPTWLHWRRQMGFMRETLLRADGVIANTGAARDAFVECCPALDPERLTVITNGWEAGDFADGNASVCESAEAAAPRDKGTFRLVFTGNLTSSVLYPDRTGKGLLRRLLTYDPEGLRASGRTPKHLLGAVRKLRSRGSPAGSAVRLVVVGPVDDASRRCAEESGVADAVEFVGHVTHAESIRWVRGADALFLALHGLPPGRRSLIVPGKTYEYLAACRPILGCLPPGEARELVEATKTGACADPCNEDEIAAALESLYARWLARDEHQARSTPSWLAAFERRALTEKLVRFIETIKRDRDSGNGRQIAG